MRVPVEYRSASKKCYESFCKAHPNINISFDKWKEIIYTHNEMFAEYILETGDIMKLPWGFGKLSIAKRKQKRTKEFNGKVYIILPIDWKKTKEEGKRIYHLNHHTDGYRFQWKWFPSSALFYQANVWNFKPTRVLSRTLGAYLKKKDKNYSDIYAEWNYRQQFK